MKVWLGTGMGYYDVIRWLEEKLWEVENYKYACVDQHVYSSWLNKLADKLMLNAIYFHEEDLGDIKEDIEEMYIRENGLQCALNAVATGWSAEDIERYYGGGR